MKKTKKYFKWLTFLSAPLLATTSLFALTSCSSEESSSSSSSGGSSSGSNGGSSSSNKEIPEGKVLLSDLVNNKKMTVDSRPTIMFLDLTDSYNYDNVAWQYTDGTSIEYKVTIQVENGYSSVTRTKFENGGQNLRANNIPGFIYKFTIFKNFDSNKINYKNIPSELINETQTNNYLLPFNKQAIVLDEFNKKASAVSLVLDDNSIWFKNYYTSYSVINDYFGNKINENYLFNGKNGERYYRFNEDNYKNFFDENISGPPTFDEFENLKGSINIEI